MPSARQLVANRTDLLDPATVLSQFPWLLQKNLDCIVSPDADGMLCGLFMSQHLAWQIRGFYDGKVLVCDHKINPSNCIFLDMEIYRAGVRSAGQHMLLYNKRNVPSNWTNFNDSFSINNFRCYDANTEFSLKYPFGTIHFLVAALQGAINITVPNTVVAPLLFIDGTYHNLFRYTENSLDWLRFLNVGDTTSPLHQLFLKDKHTIHELMSLMDQFWEARDKLSISGERGDRIAITRRGANGGPHNVILQTNGQYSFNLDAKARGEAFLKLLDTASGWSYNPNHWTWQGWKVLVFDKGQEENITIPKFRALMARDPLSFAITAGRRIEYTLDPQNQFH